MKKLLLMFVVIGSCGAYAQNVGINGDGTTPDASAGLDIKFTNKGVLIPRVALTSVNDVTTVPSPATSLLVYNNGILTPHGFYYWNGTLWVGFGAQGPAGPQGPAGATGAQGSAGAQGPQGPAGAAITTIFATEVTTAAVTTDNNYKVNWSPATTFPAGTYAIIFTGHVTNGSTSGTPSLQIRNAANTVLCTVTGLAGTAGVTVSATTKVTFAAATTLSVWTSRGFGGSSSMTTTLTNPSILAIPVAP